VETMLSLVVVSIESYVAGLLQSNVRIEG